MPTTSNISEFDRMLADFGKRALSDLYLKLFRILALGIFTGVVVMTPRDTGRAQNGWDVAVNAPSQFMPPEGADTYQAADIGRCTAALSTLRYGDMIIITNNVVYIVPLNEGHSKRAPVHFVELAIESALSMLNRGSVEL